MNRRMRRQARGQQGQQVQQLQQSMVKLQKLQEELEVATVEATAGGGVVKVVVSGKMRLESVTIDPEVVVPEDVDMLQDLVMAAVNEGMEKSQEMVSARMSGVTGGLNIPGLT